MSTSVVTNGSISTINGFAAASSARLGSNGDDGGDWEYMVQGSATTAIVVGRKIWDDDPETEIEADDVDVSLSAAPGGGTNGVSWTVSGGKTVPIYCSNASYGAISSVKIRALVRDANCQFSFDGVTVVFYKNGSIVESIPYSTIIADTTGGGTVQEQIVTFTPSANDNTKVVISGKLNFVYPDAEIDNPDTVSGQFYIFS